MSYNFNDEHKASTSSQSGVIICIPSQKYFNNQTRQIITSTKMNKTNYELDISIFKKNFLTKTLRGKIYPQSSLDLRKRSYIVSTINYFNSYFVFLSILMLAKNMQAQLTPVIGGKCTRSSPDIYIGGKQTQFFLKCERAADSGADDGIWVVKSRQQEVVTPTHISAAEIAERSANADRSTSSSSTIKKASSTKVHAPERTAEFSTELTPAQLQGCNDENVRPSTSCAINDNCLYAVYGNHNEYLQCDPVDHRWTTKHCEKGYTFNLAQQSCALPTAKGGSFRQYPSGGLACSYTQCSPLTPCTIGTCNGGYCCTSAPSPLPPVPAAYPSLGTCSSGFTSPVKCEHLNGGRTCPPGLFCDVSANLCCPLLLALPSVSAASLQPQIPKMKGTNVGTGTINQIGTGRLRGTSGGTIHISRVGRLTNNADAYAPPRHTDLISTMRMMMPPRMSTNYISNGKQNNVLPANYAVRGNRGGNGLNEISPNSGDNDIMPGVIDEIRYFGSDGGGSDTFNGFYNNRRSSAYENGDYDAYNNVGMSSYGTHPDTNTISRRRRRTCPGGIQPYGFCNAGVCAPNFQCTQPANICCPSSFPQLAPPPPQIFSPPIIPISPLLPPPPPVALTTASYCPGGLAGGSCVSGHCAPGYACSPPSNVCCAQMTQAIPATVCPDGTQAAGACVDNQCGTGFICNQGLCCASSSQTPRCLDGSQAIGACIQGSCGTGYSCTTGNICCPSTLNCNTCPNGQVSIGTCVNGQCPIGYACINNQCCGDSNTSTISCSFEDSRGPCPCQEPGTECDTANNWCCPRTMGDPVGPCILGETGKRLCPDGYACTGPGTGQCYRLETNSCPPEEQFGPCAPTEPQCPQGYMCIGEFCCSVNGENTLRRRFKRRAPVFMQWM